MKKDPYEVLGISRTATPDEIKKAYRAMALKHHPDRNPGDAEAESRFKEIADSYEMITNPKKAAHADFTGGGFGNPFGGDIFSHFFNMSRGNPNEDAINITQKVVVQVSLQEVLTGCSREISFQFADDCVNCKGTGGEDSKKCGQCGGNGSVQASYGSFVMNSSCGKCQGRGVIFTKRCKDCKGIGKQKPRQLKTTAQIPAGVDHGSRFTIKVGGREDILIEVIIQNHPVLKREGKNIFVVTPVSYPRMVLGGEMTIPGLNGPIKITIPANSPQNSRVIVGGEGLPAINSPVRGDLYAILQIDMASNYNEDSQKMLRELLEFEEANPSAVTKRFRDFTQASSG